MIFLHQVNFYTLFTDSHWNEPLQGIFKSPSKLCANFEMVQKLYQTIQITKTKNLLIWIPFWLTKQCYPSLNFNCLTAIPIKLERSNQSTFWVLIKLTPEFYGKLILTGTYIFLFKKQRREVTCVYVPNNSYIRYTMVRYHVHYRNTPRKPYMQG